MARGIERPVFTTVLEDGGELRPEPGSLYIAGVSVEERSRHMEEWESSCEEVRFVRVVEQGAYEATVAAPEGTVRIGLRGSRGIASFLEKQGCRSVYLDVTGLAHHVWVPLLRGMSALRVGRYCVYVEPGDYRMSGAPTEDSIFDLSESITGIRPLPGLARLGSGLGAENIFVPLLGFEGARFTFVLDAVDPKREDVFPVIGVPGFRPEYPFYTYVGNSLQLEETRAFSNVRYAAANCPFALYQVLEDLRERNKDRGMIIAPIGTKPHALGAVMYSLEHADRTEIVYDHPVRKARRTQGTSRVCVYDMSLFPRLDAGAGGTRGAGR